jgi:hypothetical protein
LALKVDRHVGVLVEIRFDDEKVTVAEAEQFVVATRAIVSDTAVRLRRRVVICTDLRNTGVFPQEVSDTIIGLMRRDNPHVERNGAVGNWDAAVFTLQVQRMFMEAGSPGRRQMFTNAERLRQWLNEVLRPDEQARLKTFLDELAPSAAAQSAARR